MSNHALAFAWLAVLASGCSSGRSVSSKPAELTLTSQERVFFEGKLGEWQLPVSIVPAPGWRQRESDEFLSVVHQNGNVLNINPAHGPNTGSRYDPIEGNKEWVELIRKQGSDIVDSREFMAGVRPGSYMIYVASDSKSYQSPAGCIQGEVGGDVRIGLIGFFHPGDTDFNEITAMLKTIKVEKQ